MESENERKICEDAIKKWGEYNNALYGYMMWNLGETKIFCPNNIKLPRWITYKLLSTLNCNGIYYNFILPIILRLL